MYSPSDLQPKNALARLCESLRIRKAQTGDSVLVAVTRERLAKVYSALGDDAMAESCLKEATHIRKLFFGDSHESLASLYYEIGCIKDNSCQLTQAAVYFNNSLDIRRESLGDAHPLVTDTLYRLGCTLFEMGDRVEAGNCFIEVVQVRSPAPEYLFEIEKSEAKREQKKQVADMFFSVGNSYLERGRREHTLAAYDEAVRVQREACGQYHEDVGSLLFGMATQFLECDMNGEALWCMEECCSVRRQTLGEGHPSLAALLKSIGLVYEKQLKIEQCLHCYEDAVDTWKGKAGYEDEVGELLVHMAELYTDQGNERDAIRCYELEIETGKQGVKDDSRPMNVKENMDPQHRLDNQYEGPQTDLLNAEIIGSPGESILDASGLSTKKAPPVDPKQAEEEHRSCNAKQNDDINLSEDSLKNRNGHVTQTSNDSIASPSYNNDDATKTSNLSRDNIEAYEHPEHADTNEIKRSANGTANEEYEIAKKQLENGDVNGAIHSFLFIRSLRIGTMGNSHPDVADASYW